MNPSEINNILLQAKALQTSLKIMAEKAMKDLPAQMAKLTDKDKVKLAKQLNTLDLQGTIDNLNKKIKDGY